MLLIPLAKLPARENVYIDTLLHEKDRSLAQHWISSPYWASFSHRGKTPLKDLLIKDIKTDAPHLFADSHEAYNFSPPPPDILTGTAWCKFVM